MHGIDADLLARHAALVAELAGGKRRGGDGGLRRGGDAKGRGIDRVGAGEVGESE